MNMYYAIRMCEVAVQATGSGLPLERATEEDVEIISKTI